MLGGYFGGQAYPGQSGGVELVPTLAIQDAFHAQAADNITLSENFLLTIQNAAHAQVADEVAIGAIPYRPTPLQPFMTEDSPAFEVNRGNSPRMRQRRELVSGFVKTGLVSMQKVESPFAVSSPSESPVYSAASKNQPTFGLLSDHAPIVFVEGPSVEPTESLTVPRIKDVGNDKATIKH